MSLRVHNRQVDVPASLHTAAIARWATAPGGTLCCVVSDAS